jgi:hypothetical protein
MLEHIENCIQNTKLTGYVYNNSVVKGSFSNIKPYARLYKIFCLLLSVLYKQQRGSTIQYTSIHLDRKTTVNGLLFIGFSRTNQRESL